MINHGNVKYLLFCIFPKKLRSTENLVVFGHGYRTQDDLKSRGPSYNNYQFLAEYFTSHGFAFLSIQHDLIGDNDGLETIDPNSPQVEARKHLWVRGSKNINFCLNYLKTKHPEIHQDKFIIAGHSNGGDIAKYYANNHEEKIDYIISLDGRRAPIKKNSRFKILMFEASDTALDENVIPGGLNPRPGDKELLEYMLVKPRNALHAELNDNGNKELQKKICDTINFFLNLNG